MQSEPVNAKAYPASILENMLALAEELNKASFYGTALEVRTLAQSGPDRTPFGYFWQHVAEGSGKVVNSGFIRHAGAKMMQQALHAPERPLCGMPGFIERITPLYASTASDHAQHRNRCLFQDYPCRRMASCADTRPGAHGS